MQHDGFTRKRNRDEDSVTSMFDQNAYERERGRLPRFIVRPPQGEKDWFEHEHAWELVYEWSVARYLDKGWECRSISANDVIVRAESFEAAAEQERARRRRVEAWADEFLNSGVIRATTPSDREAVVYVAEARLREIVNDGFLVRALEAANSTANKEHGA